MIIIIIFIIAVSWATHFSKDFQMLVTAKEGEIKPQFENTRKSPPNPSNVLPLVVSSPFGQSKRYGYFWQCQHRCLNLKIGRCVVTQLCSIIPVYRGIQNTCF